MIISSHKGGVPLIQQINSDTVFFDGCETHYGLRSYINASDYPQVHDFFEIILVVAGKMNVSVNTHLLELKKGNMLLIRPKDVHSKIETGPCQHVNLAFPSYTVEALFHFLYDSNDKWNDLFSSPHVPVCTLTGLDTTLLLNRLSYLNLLPATSLRRKNTYLRTLLTDIISLNFMEEIEKQKKVTQNLTIPTWLMQAVAGLSDINNLEEGMAYLVRQSNRTPEHICRAFRKYLNTTPSTLINAKRLNYAANLLQHSDKEIIDIAYESGFQSVSHFYHLFKKEYHMAPLQYKNRHYAQRNF